MDLFTLAKDIGIPLAGALLGYAGAAKLAAHRVGTLEANFKEYKAENKEVLDALKKGFRFELDGLKGELREDLKNLQAKLEEVDDTIENFQQKSNHDFAKDAELSKFIEEQQRLWQAIQRTMGQIEGTMRNLK